MAAERAPENGFVPEPSLKKPLDSWVQCDRCDKWRRIPQTVAESLADDAPWYCEMNTGSIYNECDVPQELTDQQIDQIHEVEDASAKAQPQGKLRKRPPVWQIIKQNIYTHRACKQQDEDDIMICQCPRLWGAPDPKVVGCGPNCLNRMLNIECVTEFCPCGERCSNQMFTRREYAALDVKRAGAKGFGLFTTKALKPGDFIIEYIGEVLEEEEYHRRKEFYIKTGQRHVYFMNIGNGEVIDACRRGGLGRFINHSCDPNCETQKWLVHGELAIGLFALRDVDAGEELTFDYNFERYGDKPMKCLCGSKNCRGIIGGVQEGMQSTREAIVPVDAQNEPEPIMVTEEDEDKALAAILDRVVGLGWEKGWNGSMQRRLQALASSHGVDLEALSEDEEEEREEEEGDDEEISEISSEGGKLRQGFSDGQETSEAGEVSAGAATTTSSGRRGWAAASPRKQKAAASKAAKAAQRQQQQLLRRGSEQGEVGEARCGDAAWEEAQAAAALAAKLHVAGSKKQRILAASQAAKAAALASQQLPFRKRLKKLARAAKAAAAGSAEQLPPIEGSTAGASGGAPAPATSTASQRSGTGALQRQPSKQSARQAQAQSVASTSTALGGFGTAATTTPLIPKRTSVHHAATGMASVDRTGGKVRRRSEIDRRLDELVGPSGRLRDTSPAAIIRFLRLFNLCDIGPTISKAEETALQERHRDFYQQPPQREPSWQRGGQPPPGRPASPAIPSWQRQQEPAAVGLDARTESIPCSRTDSDRPSEERQARSGSPGDQREEGEVSPAQSEEGAPAPEQPSPDSPPRHQQQQQQSGSPTRDRDRIYREDEGVSRLRAAREELQQRGELSPRQRARLADMSLLLDVVLKTNTQSARREFVKCGILRQLLATIGHNVGPQYGIILRKVFRVVESLPFTADDMHHTRSAHGSFADLLRELTQHSDYEVRNKAWALLRQFPFKDCTRPPLAAGYEGGGGGLHSNMPSSAASSRSRPLWEPGPQVRSPHYRGVPPLPHEAAVLMSPSYSGRSPHRDHQASRLGGMHRGGGPPPREPQLDSARSPYMGQHAQHPQRLPFPSHQPLGPTRGYPSVPPSLDRPRFAGGEESREPHGTGPLPGSSHPWPSGEPPLGGCTPGGGEGRNATRGLSGFAAEAPLPSAFDGRVAAESIAAAFVSSAAKAGLAVGAEEGQAPAALSLHPFREGDGLVLATTAGPRRKRSRWEREEDQDPQRGSMEAQGLAQAKPGAAASSPSLLPPGFGGAATRQHSPPPHPPSVLATRKHGSEGQDGRGEAEPPTKRSAAAAAGGGDREAGLQDTPMTGVQQLQGDTSAEGTPMQRLASILREHPSWDVETQYAEGGYTTLTHAYSNGGGCAIDGVTPGATPSAQQLPEEPEAGEGGAVAAAGVGVVSGVRSEDAGISEPYSPVRESMDISPIREGPATAQQPQQLPPLPRPHSGTLSNRSRGDSGTSGPGLGGRQQLLASSPPPPLHPLAPSLTTLPQLQAAPAVASPSANGNGMHLSPLTDPSPSSQSHPGSIGAAAGSTEAAAQETAESALTGGAAFFSGIPTVQDESWDEPSSRFERFVLEVVRARIGKYVHPEHPARLDLQEAMQLYTKVSSQVIAKEHEAYADRQRSGLHKPIVRARLEGKIREFVRDSVKRMLGQRAQLMH